MKIGFIVLCGGKGRRIEDRLNGVPKILAPIGQRKALDYILEWINLYPGDKDIYLCTGHLSKQIEDYVKGKSLENIKILKEEKQRGTLPCTNEAIQKYSNEYFLIMNGDTLVAINPKQIAEKALEINSNLLLTLVPSKINQYTILNRKVKKAMANSKNQTYQSTGLLWVKREYWMKIQNEIKNHEENKENCLIDDLLENIMDIDPLIVKSKIGIHDYGTADRFGEREEKFETIMRSINKK